MLLGGLGGGAGWDNIPLDKTVWVQYGEMEEELLIRTGYLTVLDVRKKEERLGALQSGPTTSHITGNALKENFLWFHSAILKVNVS